MTLIAAGVSHRTAPVAERERLAVASHELAAALARLRQTFGNGVVLATCNRTEVYVSAANGEVHPAELMYALADFKGLGRQAALPRFYELEGREVVGHLFRVAAGVDSMILGEPQILGQVRAALSASHAANALDAGLSRLFHEALRTGKRARHETAIARFAVSVSSAAVDLAREQLPSLAEARTLVVGAGEAGKLAARALRDAGVRRLVVLSRTAGRAEDLAAYLSAESLPFARLPEALADADLVITSSSAPAHLIDAPLVQRVRAGRDAPVTFIDLAVPRDVDPAVARLPGVRLFDLDDLQAVSEANLRLRERAAADVARIVQEAAEQFERWLAVRGAVPTIAALVQEAERIRRAEVDRTARDLDLDEAGRAKVDRMAAAIVKKLLHRPITHLRYAGEERDAARLVRDLFGVGES